MNFLKRINTKLIAALLIVSLFSSILFYKLNDQYMWTDEVFSFHAAEMIIEKGEAVYDSGLKYVRAGAYHHLLATSMEIFGENEFGSRIINIPFAAGTSLIMFFFILNIFKKSEKKYLYALSGAILFLTTNFTLAGVRETRMYTMATFFLTSSVIAFYKAFLDDRIKKISYFNFNPLWSGLFLLSFGIAYNTHAISALLLLGIFLFLFITSLINRKKEIFGISLLLGFGGLIFIYLQYGTLNLYDVFMRLSPPWGTEGPNILYYPVLLVRNFPVIFLISPVILWQTYTQKKTIHIYLLTIFLTFLFFISIQTAQNERYLTPILPTMLMLTLITVLGVLENISKKSLYYYFLFLTLIVGTITHLYLFTKELNEIDTYTRTSISIHKKFEFNSVFDYLKEQNLQEVTLIADEQSAYSLYSKGFKTDYILVPQNKDILSQNIINGKNVDIYFNIRFLSYKEQLAEFLKEEHKPALIILRNFEDFTGIDGRFKQVNGLDKPRIYLEESNL